MATRSARQLCRLMPAAVMFAAFLAVPAHGARERKSYRLDGRVLQSDGKPFTGATPVVFLQGAITPFSRQTLAGRDGKFRFKDVPAGTYTLSVAAPRVGEFRRTVEVGPSVADAKGTVTVTIAYDQTIPIERGGRISTAELSVSDEAMDEYRSAQRFMSRGDHARAAERLRKAVDLSPQFATAWNQLGTIAYQTRRYPLAEEYFRQSLKQDPEAYAPLVNLGGALLALNRFEESLEVNRAAVKARPGDALAHSQLGKSYFYLGRLDDAETHLKRAKALDAGHFSYPQVFLIEIYARWNRLPDSIAEMEEFLRLHPDSDWAPKIRELLGAARARLQGVR